MEKEITKQSTNRQPLSFVDYRDVITELVADAASAEGGWMMYQHCADQIIDLVRSQYEQGMPLYE